MVAEPVWLDRLMIECFHHDLLLQHGGRNGLRDEHALDAAIARPRLRRQCQPDDTHHARAASLCHALAVNHPFVDGNKRVAFVAMAVFLELNGWEITAAEAEVVDVMRSLASSTSGEADLAMWLEQHTKPLEG